MIPSEIYELARALDEGCEGKPHEDAVREAWRISAALRAAGYVLTPASPEAGAG